MEAMARTLPFVPIFEVSEDEDLAECLKVIEKQEGNFSDLQILQLEDIERGLAPHLFDDVDLNSPGAGDQVLVNDRVQQYSDYSPKIFDINGNILPLDARANSLDEESEEALIDEAEKNAKQTRNAVFESNELSDKIVETNKDGINILEISLPQEPAQGIKEECMAMSSSQVQTDILMLQNLKCSQENEKSTAESEVKEISSHGGKAVPYVLTDNTVLQHSKRKHIPEKASTIIHILPSSTQSCSPVRNINFPTQLKAEAIRFPCKLCKKTFASIKFLKHHAVTCAGLQCHLCQKTFETEYLLRMHTHSKHRTRLSRKMTLESSRNAFTLLPCKAKSRNERFITDASGNRTEENGLHHRESGMDNTETTSLGSVPYAYTQLCHSNIIKENNHHSISEMTKCHKTQSKIHRKSVGIEPPSNDFRLQANKHSGSMTTNCALKEKQEMLHASVCSHSEADCWNTKHKYPPNSGATSSCASEETLDRVTEEQVVANAAHVKKKNGSNTTNFERKTIICNYPQRQFAFIEKANMSWMSRGSTAINHTAELASSSEIGKTGRQTSNGVFDRAHTPHVHSRRNNCKKCKTFFTSKENLERHMSSFHVTHFCHECTMVFKNVFALRNHMRRVHEATVVTVVPK